MKQKIISIAREDWEKLREFKKAPFKKRYIEILEMDRFLEKQFVAEIKKIH